MENYNKDECLALLRNSADARHYRASMVIGAVLFGFGLLFGLLFLLTGISLRENADLWSCSLFYQKHAFGVLDWPLVSEYANCQVIAAFDQKKERAIILQRDYRTRT